MKVKKLIRKYYASALLILFTMTLVWGIGQTVLNSKAFASDSRSAANTLKIVHLSDVHIDSVSKNKGGRMFSSSQKLLKDAVSQINKMNSVDMVAFSGDNINRPVRSDLLNFFRIANSINRPWYSALGNHDVCVGGYLSKKKYMSMLNSFNLKFNSLKPYYVVAPKKRFRVIFLDGVIDDKITSRGHFSEQQLSWLDDKLDEFKKKKVVIVQHFPVVEPYKSKSHRVDNAEEYLDVIDKHKNVVAVLAGHYHCSRIKKRKNVLHITTPSLVQYPNSFRVVTISDDKKTVKINSKIYKTKLSDVRQKSKKAVKFASALLNGLASDRDTVFYLSK